MHAGSLQLCRTLCDPVDCGLPGFSFRDGSLWARILEHIGQYWLPYPSRALYFLLPWLPTPLSTWCCKNTCDPNSCTISTPGPHRGKPKFSRAASGANPRGWPTCKRMKPQLKPMGSVAKEEDPKPSHQQYQLRIKSTQSTRHSVSMEYKRSLRAPTKEEKALVLTAVDIGSKNT